MIHELLKTWFTWVEQWGYWGVFVLMAMESSITPVPSEVVMPPAAFWAAQGRMDFWGIVAAGTAGSYFGATLSYFVAKAVGFPVVKRYGKFFLISADKFEFVERWVRAYGMPGIFLARLLPVVRHLISIPAGIFKMPFARFSAMTIAGAGIWCWILSWFGQTVIGAHPELLQSPEQMVLMMKSELHKFVAGVAVLTVLYIVVVRIKRKKNPLFTRAGASA